MCRLKTFCFRFSLRAGAIAAAVHTALGLASMILYTAWLFYVVYYYENLYIPASDEDGKPEKLADNLVLYLYILGGVFLAVCLSKLIVLVILCVGIHKNRSNLVLIWLIWTGFELILLPILIVLGAVLLEHWWSLIGLLYVATMFYLYLATCSYHKDLVDGFLRPSPL